MSAKEYSGDRKRSRPVTKKSKLDIFKKNSYISVFIVIIVVIVAISGAYVLISNDDGDSETIEENPIAIMDTSMGIIKIELFMDKAPITAKNFYDHAKSGYYDGVILHRVIPGFMIQGGDPLGTGSGGHAAEYHKGYGDSDDPDSWVIPDEFHEDLSNVRGNISMANRGANTGGSQFFINVVDNLALDYNKYLDQTTGQVVHQEVPYPQDSSKHAVFGKVIEGMDIVDQISVVNTDPSNNKPYTDVVINSITFEEWEKIWEIK